MKVDASRMLGRKGPESQEHAVLSTECVIATRSIRGFFLEEDLESALIWLENPESLTP